MLLKLATKITSSQAMKSKVKPRASTCMTLLTMNARARLPCAILQPEALLHDRTRAPHEVQSGQLEGCQEVKEFLQQAPSKHGCRFAETLNT